MSDLDATVNPFVCLEDDEASAEPTCMFRSLSKMGTCVNSSPCGSISAPESHMNLLVVSNKYGYVIHATQNGTITILHYFSHGTGFYFVKTDNVSYSSQGVKHNTTHPVQHLELSHDELILAVVTTSEVRCFMLARLHDEVCYLSFYTHSFCAE